MNRQFFFNTNKPAHLGMLVGIFVYIVLLNVITNVFAVPLEELGYTSWAFFLVNIAYFLLGEEVVSKKFTTVLVGSVTGCILAYLTMQVFLLIMPSTGSHGVLIPIAASLFLVIIVGPFMPAFFNTVTFLYFLASLISPETAITNVVPNICFAVAGCIIANGGCQLIINLYTKHAMKKAAEQKTPQS